MASKTWFITGASRGFGRIWTEAALARGDRVAATARDAASLQDLVDRHGDRVLPLSLDVTDRAAVFDVMARAHERLGRIDVLVNNAGYGLNGTVEEVSEDEARAQMETNFFGALWVIQAAVPLLRAQGGGHIVSVSSIGGIGAFPMFGIYNASKWALEAVNEALAGEVAGFGIKVTLIEPGPFATDWGGSSLTRATALPAYDPLREGQAAYASSVEQGDPNATAEAILKVVDAEEPPLRLFLGPLPLMIARTTYAARLATWEAWADVADAAHGKAG